MLQKGLDASVDIRRDLRLHRTSEVDLAFNFDLDRNFFEFAIGRARAHALREYKLDPWRVTVRSSGDIGNNFLGDLYASIQTRQRTNGEHADRKAPSRTALEWLAVCHTRGSRHYATLAPIGYFSEL